MYLKDFSTKHNGSHGFNLSLFKCHKEKHDNITEAASLHKRAVPECTLTELVLKMICFKAVGFCSGALIGGILSDIHGRRITCLSLSIIWNFCTWSLTMSPMEYMVEMFYIVTVMCCSAINVVTFVNFAEITSRKTRILSIFSISSYTIGDHFFHNLSRKITTWKYLQSFVASTMSIMIFACWYIPESPRWLLNKNKRKAAYEQLNDVSGLRYNINTPPHHEDPNLKKTFVPCEMFLFLYQRVLKDFVIFNLLVSISSLTYTSGKLKAILHYVHTDELEFLTTVAEGIGFLFFIPVYMFLGNRFGLFFVYMLLAIEVLLALLTYDFLQALYFNVFGMALGITTLSLIWFYILDVFPTFLRGTAVGCAFSIYGVATAGGVFLVNQVEKYKEFNYYLTIFVAALLGLSVLALPNTANKELPNFKLNR
ncbi:unnamed protein product [Tenebrio molitor]|nr:unnamed protein product [Tenebrio molitor]